MEQSSDLEYEFAENSDEEENSGEKKKKLETKKPVGKLITKKSVELQRISEEILYLCLFSFINYSRNFMV